MSFSSFALSLVDMMLSLFVSKQQFYRFGAYYLFNFREPEMLSASCDPVLTEVAVHAEISTS